MKLFRATQWLLAIAFACAFFWGCVGKHQADEGAVTIAIEGDVSSFNPLFTDDLVSDQIAELLFPHLVEPEFDYARGILSFSPFLASSWEFSRDSSEIAFLLRRDAFWSDGVRVTARDVQFSFELYADTVVASVRQGVTQHLRRQQGRVNVATSVVPTSDSTIVFRFEKGSATHLFDLGVPLIPHHVLDTVPRAHLRSHRFNTAPITSGPFLLERRVPLQQIVLRANRNGWCGITPKVTRLVFKVLPEYQTRVAQLESGEVDIVTGLRVEDADPLLRQERVALVSTVGRDYDFIGWNHIDPQVYRASRGRTIEPHPLFGSKNVRRALTMAIDRTAIVRAYLGKHGQEAFGGISPLFAWAYNDTLKPLPFDLERSARLLEKEGWRDADGDGVLEKAGRRFAFTLKIASGNPLRDVIATVVQQQLKQVKIDMKIERVERSTFWNALIERKYDAWIAGFRLPLQLQLDVWWNSNLQRSPFNLVGFRHPRVDEILERVRSLKRQEDGAALWKEFQALVHEEQPYTFLFWINDLVAVSKRVRGTQIGIFGPTYKAWEWYVQ